VGNRGRDNLPSFLVAAFIGIVIWVFGRKRKARFAISLQQDRRQTRVFKGCSI
jgi:hypothetical protein